jgi:VIT1/CCC1 family predicted Fe2+/Mn2+ transporter
MLLSLFHRKPSYTQSLFRSSIFGLEDSLVSTVGFLSGFVVTGPSSATITKSGLILVMVEAFSMGIGTFLSENNSEEIIAKKTIGFAPAIKSGFVMYFSYVIGGLFVLSPYFFLSAQIGSFFSIVFSLLGLSCVGLFTAHLAKTSYLTELVKALLIGGVATLIGIAVGKL